MPSIVPIAYAYDSLEQIALQVKASCFSTHHHPEAITGALAVASAIFLARMGESRASIRAYVEKHFYRLPATLDTIRPTHVFNSRASYSVPPAIAAFLDSIDYESAVRNAVSLGGDTDTQACIAGAIAEVFYHDIPHSICRFCELRLDLTIKAPVRELLTQIKAEF